MAPRSLRSVAHKTGITELTHRFWTWPMAGLMSGVSSAWPGHVFRDALLQDILYSVLGGQRRNSFLLFLPKGISALRYFCQVVFAQIQLFLWNRCQNSFLVSGRRISFIKLTGISVFIARFVEGDIHLAGVIANASTVELLQHLGNWATHFWLHGDYFTGVELRMKFSRENIMTVVKVLLKRGNKQHWRRLEHSSKIGYLQWGLFPTPHFMTPT